MIYQIPWTQWNFCCILENLHYVFHERTVSAINTIVCTVANYVKTAYLPKTTIQSPETQRILNDSSVNETLPVGEGRF